MTREKVQFARGVPTLARTVSKQVQVSLDIFLSLFYNRKLKGPVVRKGNRYPQ